MRWPPPRPNRCPLPVADRVYDAIYAAVIDHRLVPGSRPREEELAQAFSVSRTLVRQALRKLVEAEARATHSQNKQEAIRFSGEFHLQLARMSGNPIFVRLLAELLPTTSLLMALYKAPGEPMCVARSHRARLSSFEAGTGAAEATQMRRYLNEIERSLAKPAARTAPALRDVFGAYRETLRARPDCSGSPPAWPKAAIHGRFDHSAIDMQPDFQWPGDARLAVR